MHLAIQPVLAWPLVAIAAVALAALVAGTYRQALSALSGRWRWLAFGMRMIALLLAVSAMLRPSLVFTETRKQSASLLILYDHSRSMLVADAWDGLPRWRAMNQTVQRSQDAMQRLRDLLDVREFRFDGRLIETAPRDEPPDGSRTAIGDALREAIQQAPGRVAAVVLLGDGANTAGTPPLSVAQSLRDLAVPLYTVGFGQEAAVESARDLAMRTIAAGPTIFEKNKLTVVGELDARGFPGNSVSLNLRFNGQTVDSRSIELPQSDGRSRVELGFVPTVPGEHKVTLEVLQPEPKKGELVESNNSISTFVTVLKGGLRVQLLDGGLESWEGQFIRRALDKSPDIKVDFTWVRDDRVLSDGRVARTLFDRSLYDVFIVRDIQKNRFPPQALERLQQAVESGAGFAMLGGRQSFGPGGYAGSPVAAILPVVVHPGDRPVDRSVVMQPTNQGLNHFVMRLGSMAETPQLWRGLLPLEGASTFTERKGTALLLGESADGLPLVVAQDYGSGRSMAVAVDTTWHWHLKNEQSLRHHRRFWRQVILWLARKEQAGESRVWVDLAKRRVGAGEGLEVTAGADDEQGNPVADAEFETSVRTPDGTTMPLKLVPHGDRMRATFWGTAKAGDYELTVTARRNGQELSAPRYAKFLVFEDDSELAAPAADLSLLRQLAELTPDGEYVPPERLPAFLNSLLDKDLHLEIDRLSQLRLWDNPYFFLLFVALLTAEWAIRKWKGLV